MAFRSAAALVLPLSLGLSGIATAGEVKVGYAVSYLGLTIARANLVLKVENGLYSAGLGYKTTGMVKVVSDAKGEAEAKGAVVAGKIMAARYTLKSDEGADSKDVVVESEAGAVTKSSAEPPLKTVDKRVPIRPEQLKATLDPLSGAVFPTVGANPLDPAACARTVPVFDGWTRYDIAFSHKTTRPVKAKGFSGDGLVCAARWIPVAGHRPDTAGVKFMTENKDMEVTLVPTAMGFLVPAQIRIATLGGTILITAERIDGAQD